MFQIIYALHVFKDISLLCAHAQGKLYKALSVQDNQNFEKRSCELKWCLL